MVNSECPSLWWEQSTLLNSALLSGIISFFLFTMIKLPLTDVAFSLHPFTLCQVSTCQPMFPLPPFLPESFLCPCVTGQVPPERNPGRATNRNGSICLASSSLSVTAHRYTWGLKLRWDDSYFCLSNGGNNVFIASFPFLLHFPRSYCVFFRISSKYSSELQCWLRAPTSGHNQAKMLNHVPKVTKLDHTPGRLAVEPVIFPTASHAS